MTNEIKNEVLPGEIYAELPDYEAGQPNNLWYKTKGMGTKYIRADLAETRPANGFQDQAQLLEVLNFIEKCRSFKVITGAADVVDHVIARSQLSTEADALYKKLEAKKWGVIPPAPEAKGGE